MSWFLLMVAVVFLAWKLIVRPPQPGTMRGEGRRSGTQPEVVSLDSGLTMTINTTGGGCSIPPEEAAEYALRMAVADERESNAIPWCTDTSIQLPIKALTGYQWHCLREARLRYQIVPKDMDALAIDSLNDPREWPQRTINSLVKHGMLKLGEGGAYSVTNVGLRALETLPVK